MFKYLDNVFQIEEHIANCNLKRDYIVIDTETTDKNPHKAKLVDIQLSGIDNKDAVMFPSNFVYLLNALQKPLVAHNYKYDWIVLKRHNVDMRRHKVYDTMLMYHLFDENKPYGLEDVYNDLMGQQTDYKTKFWDKYKNYIDATLEDRLDYGCSDIVKTDLIYRYLIKEVYG